jgi:4-diphosphocytidyl-2-C-methyl-D-erythritol kinase
MFLLAASTSERWLTAVPETTITLPAFAKINLGLRVLGKRSDGYHELDTVFQTVSLHDTITLTATDSPQIILSCDDRSLPTDAGNLVYRAAKALQGRFAPDKGVRISLGKRIPPQAGLGGGSSDGAVTLVALAYLWRVDAKVEELLEIASSLGADGSFFCFGGTARGTGTGNDIAPLPDLPDRFLLVIKPKASVSTSDAYRSLKARSLTTVEAKTILSSSEWSGISYGFDSETLGNDFEPAVFEIEPEISRAKVALMKAGAEAALLAGSGSAVFGIFDSGDTQERAIQAIELESGWRVFPCRTVGRSHYRSAMGPCGAILERFTGP